jgi:para-nitrobenzyl esterase
MRSAWSRSLSLLLAVMMFAVLAGLAVGCGPVTVATTSLGRVQGATATNSTVVFKGIPYAAPPTGSLRFLPPQPAKAWSGTRQATKFSSAEVQPRDALTGTSQARQSEDCLYLNVWTPRVDTTKRPVMLWIHGGGFVNGAGSDPLYDGAKLAASGDVVVVTINYRLGPFGFLYLKDVGGQDYAQSGNLGLLDQIAAIKWVRDNASAFGGDPGNLTVFGESAGSMSVCSLLGMPAAKGLFRRAIAESGAVNMLHSARKAAGVTAQFMKTAGVADVAGLRGMSAREMVAAETAMTPRDRSSEMQFGPVLDGTAIPVTPLEAIRTGSATGVDLMIGTNLDEVRLWALAVPGLTQYPLSIVSPYWPTAAGAISLTSLGTPDAVSASYQSRRPEATPGDVSLAALTDLTFRVPAIRVAETQGQQQSKTWMYLFTWPSPSLHLVRSCHAIELPFVFGNLKNGRIQRLVGSSPPVNLSQAMQQAWTSFARTGNPNGKGVPNWNPYVDARATMVFNTTSGQQNDPYAEDRMVWQGVPFDSVKPPL